jgi:hypothetical protein
MANKWMTHVKKTMKKMSSQKKTLGKGWFKTVLKDAKASNSKKGGAESPSPADESVEGDKDASKSVDAAMGGRRRRTRRHRKH